MTPPRETILFEAISTPPQSFTVRGFRVLAGLLILAAAIPAAVFFALGAWPVLPFIGLEVGAALAALLWHARASLADIFRRRKRLNWLRHCAARWPAQGGRISIIHNYAIFSA